MSTGDHVIEKCYNEAYPTSMNARNLLQHILGLPRNLIVVLITGYQKTLSPDHGPLKHLYAYGYCRHSPTCSQYAKEQIQRRGIFIGGALSMKRLLSCHPWKRIDDAALRTLEQRVYGTAK